MAAAGTVKADCPDWQILNQSTQTEDWKTCENCCNITASCLGDTTYYATTTTEQDLCTGQQQTFTNEYSECVNTHCD